MLAEDALAADHDVEDAPLADDPLNLQFALAELRIQFRCQTGSLWGIVSHAAIGNLYLYHAFNLP